MKHRKSILITVALAAVIIISLFIAGASFISKKIEKEINGSQIANFKLNSADINTNLFLGEIELSNVELVDVASSGKISIPEIRIAGIGLLKFIMQGKVSLDKVSIKNPVIGLSGKMQNREKNENPKIKSITLGKLEITGATVLYQSGETKDDTIFSSQANLEIWEISSDSGNQKYRVKDMSFERVACSMEKGEYYLPGQLYRVLYKGFQYDSDSARLAVANFEFVTNEGKYEIGQKRGVEIDWFDFTGNGFEIKDIRLGPILAGQAIIIDEIELENFEGTAFKDKRLPLPDKPDTKLPMAMLEGLPLPFHCGLVTIGRADIRYEERVDNSSAAGFVSFNELQAKIENLSNIDSLIQDTTTMTANAKVLDKSLLHAEFIFPNKKFPLAYQAKGNLEPLPMDLFNPMLKLNAGMKIESGRLEQLFFNFQYNEEHASGDAIFEYDDLKVSVLDKEDNSTKKLQSFLTNTFVVHKKNLRDDSSFREGEISFDRNKKRSIFNYWWKSLYSGIKSSAVL
jgi:hypothetical protein